MGKKTNRMNGHARQAVGAATAHEETKSPPLGVLRVSGVLARLGVLR
jgi:hypothetical protein